MIRKPRKYERQARILEALRHTPHIRIALLAERFKVTTETIRRDLDSLSRRGLVNRAHGGVVAQPMGVQPSIFEREQSTVDERSRIRSEEHTSELQSLMRISYAVFCLKKKKTHTKHT